MQVRYQNFYSIIENPKTSDGIQFTGRCPLHDDRNNSFSYRLDTGVCTCFVGCVSGGAYDLAILMGMQEEEARKLMTNYDENWKPNNVKSIDIKPTTSNTPKIIKPNKEIIDDIKRFIKNRKENYHLAFKYWKEDVLDQLGVGVNDAGDLTFPYKINGDVIGYKVHKKEIKPKGVVKNHMYPNQLIGSYDHDKPLYIVEGEKDVVTLLSRGLQAISVINGAYSMPKRKQDIIDIVKYYNADINVVYDHDGAGYDGSLAMGQFIKSELPSHKVYTGKWRDDLQKGYDCTDAFSHSSWGQNFFEALDSRIEVPKSKKTGMYAIGVKEFMKEEYTKTEPIIKNILYSNHITIIGGDTGTMKSWYAMQLACSVASGIDFLGHFEATPRKCMLIQFENENSDMQDRFKDMIEWYNDQYGSDEWQDNLVIVPKEDEGILFVNKWKEVDKVLMDNDWYDAVVIVDNLYSSTELDMSKSDVKIVLREIDAVKRHFRASFGLVAHTNKVDYKVKDLKIDQIQGNKTLVSQVSNVIMLGKSSLTNDYKIMKFVKCRSDENRDLEEMPFKIYWDNENAIFNKGAVVKHIAQHFEPNNKRWEYRLIRDVYDSMKVRSWFKREQFREHLPEEYKQKSKTWESRLLTRLDKWGLINKKDHDEYWFVKSEIEDIE